MKTKELAAVAAFVEAINQADEKRLSALMARDHRFIDSSGAVVEGSEAARNGWKKFFEMFPDYRMRVEEYLHNGNHVMAYGSAAGTYNGRRGLVKENRIAMPAAWRAVVENGKIRVWQVFSDWTEANKILEEDARAPRR